MGIIPLSIKYLRSEHPFYFLLLAECSSRDGLTCHQLPLNGSFGGENHLSQLWKQVPRTAHAQLICPDPRTLVISYAACALDRSGEAISFKQALWGGLGKRFGRLWSDRRRF